jgi:serine/threonine-protein kinase
LPIVAAVDFAHERGVLHRDIKPSNIFLARSWNGDLTPKILDFGISKLLDESQQHGLTTDSAFVGTPHYASPEAMRAERNADGRSDQYSMGVVFYEGATGVKPYAEQGGNFVALAMAICAGQFPSPRQVKPDLPPAFEAVVVKAMSLRAEDRFPSMRALGEALLPFASERARMIWTPTFSSSGSRVAAPTPQEGTQVMLRPSATTQAEPVRAFPTGGTPHSGVHPMNMHPSATPPPGSYDGTPSYSLGGRSFPGAPAPEKKSGAGSIALIIGLLVATLGLVGIGIVKVAGKTASAGTPPEPAIVASDAPAAQPSAYALAIRVVPETAAFELDGLPAGTGSLSRSLPRDGRKHALRVSAPGYETIFVEFDDARPPPASLALRPAAQPGGSAAPSRAGGSQHGTGPGPGPAGGKQGGSGKNPDNRPRTDNIDPWE